MLLMCGEPRCLQHHLRLSVTRSRDAMEIHPISVPRLEAEATCAVSAEGWVIENCPSRAHPDVGSFDLRVVELEGFVSFAAREGWRSSEAASGNRWGEHS